VLRDSVWVASPTQCVAAFEDGFKSRDQPQTRAGWNQPGAKAAMTGLWFVFNGDS